MIAMQIVEEITDELIHMHGVHVDNIIQTPKAIIVNIAGMLNYDIDDIINNISSLHPVRINKGNDQKLYIIVKDIDILSS